jgi:formate-dependent nitrite reductase membrane component NrfD
MHFLAEFLLEYLLEIPGAFIRWILFYRTKKKYSELLHDTSGLNYIATIITMFIFASVIAGYHYFIN